MLTFVLSSVPAEGYAGNTPTVFPKRVISALPALPTVKSPVFHTPKFVATTLELAASAKMVAVLDKTPCLGDVIQMPIKQLVRAKA